MGEFTSQQIVSIFNRFNKILDDLEYTLINFQNVEDISLFINTLSSMNKTLHEKASNILAKIIDLEEVKARKIIEKECGSDENLKQLVNELYANILEDNPSSEQDSTAIPFPDL